MKTGTKSVVHSSLTKSAAVFNTVIAYFIFLNKQSIMRNDNPAKLQNTYAIIFKDFSSSTSL